MLRATPTLSQIELFLGNCAEGIAEPFATFLRESTSLRALILSFTKYGERRYVDVPQASLSRICDGITESKSLQRLFFCGLPGDDDDNGNILAKALAPAIATCASLMVVTFPRSPYFAARLTNGLLQHDAVKNFDLCFSSTQTSPRSAHHEVMLKRSTPSKSLLPKISRWDCGHSSWQRLTLGHRKLATAHWMRSSS